MDAHSRPEREPAHRLHGLDGAQSAEKIEDQITYPLSLKLQGLSGVRAVRSSSEFNFSMITIIFEDNDAVLLLLGRGYSKNSMRCEAARSCRKGPFHAWLPMPPLSGPDFFFYTVEPSPSEPVDPAPVVGGSTKYYIVPQLNSAKGVSEVATVDAVHALEYQIDVNPESLRAYGVTLGDVYGAVARSNWAAGGGVIQKNNAEYLVRFVGLDQRQGKH